MTEHVQPSTPNLLGPDLFRVDELGRRRRAGSISPERLARIRERRAMLMAEEMPQGVPSAEQRKMCD